MRIAVIGAGAMGSIFGVRFTQAGHETVLVDVAAPLVETINDVGISIVRGDEETTTRVPATSDPRTVGVVDVVVFCVKSYHTPSAAEFALPLVGPDTVVASLQNGWGNGDVLAATFSPEQIVVGVTYNSGIVEAPGRVAHPAERPTTVGPFVDGSDGAARVAQALNDAGLHTEVASPVRPEIWKKLIHNAALLPTSALAGMNIGAMAACADTVALVTDTAREATAVAQALGYLIDPQERVDTISALLAKAGPTKGSMAQDFEAGRRTEIDVINGAVVRTADDLGVAVPLNRTLLQLVKSWESMRGLS